MINLTNLVEVQVLKNNLRATLETDPGKEVMKFLEQLCGWYDFKETDPNMILIAHGKRQCLATIKTLIEVPAEQIVALAEEQES